MPVIVLRQPGWMSLNLKVSESFSSGRGATYISVSLSAQLPNAKANAKGVFKSLTLLT